MQNGHIKRPCFRSFVRGAVRGWFEGSFINGSWDSKYDLHWHDILPLQLGDVNDRDHNPLCIFILILVVRRCKIICFLLCFPIKHTRDHRPEGITAR
jgi:hypothetical protein